MGFQILFRSRYDFSIFRIHNNSRLSIVFTIEVRSWLGRTIRTAEETGHGTLPLHPPQCTHWGAFHLSRGGPDGRPGVPPLRAERNSGIIRGVPLIRSSVRTGPPSPRGRLSGDRKGRPYGENAPGALAEKTQALLWNRSNSKFCTPRAQWPGENLDQSLRFCAPGIFCPTQGVTSVMGDRGKAVIGERSSPLRRPPAILWVLSHRWESTSPRRAKPCKTARRGGGTSLKSKNQAISPNSDHLLASVIFTCTNWPITSGFPVSRTSRLPGVRAERGYRLSPLSPSTRQRMVLPM